MRMIIVSAVFFFIVFFSACSYKKEPVDYPVTAEACNTQDVRYLTDITRILSANCNVCHSTTQAPVNGGGNVLDSYETVKPYVNSGLLLNVVQHSPGFDPMPKNGNKLSDCDIAKVRKWILNGSPNN